MNRHHFISYSSADAQDFALRLCDELAQGPPTIQVWLDKRELVAGSDWDDQIVEAIRDCASVIFVMTRDSVTSKSVCKKEWTRALKYKKPIIPILLHPDAEMPFSLEPRQHIDFTGAFDPALARLRNDLQHLSSPAGLLQQMKDRLADAQRDLPRAADVTKKARIQDDIAQLDRQIANQQKIVDDPEGAARRVQESIERGLERERKPERPVTGVALSKFINPPPGIAPSYFQDRHVETKLVGDFLNDESLRMMTVVGRGGVGKTAMVCRLLKSLEHGQLPDELGPMSVDGIVYLSATGSRRVTFPNIFADLCKLLPDEGAQRLDTLYKNPQAPTEAKMRTLLEGFPAGRTVLLLDNFEDLVDPETLKLRDPELDEALSALLNAPHHAVKAIITTRLTPRDLLLTQPSRQRRRDIDEGLESPFAENILREMDADGKLGLKTASDAILNEARERTRGYPRALEALFAILSADRDTSLQEVLNDAEKLLPEHVVEALVGEAFNRLDSAARQVMQALAIYGRPVTPAAIDYLLQPHLPGVNSAPILSRLVNMQFARKEAGHYYLHPVDRAYAFSRAPVGDKSDRENDEVPPYTQFALLHRGAEYFKQARLPRENWKTIEDLTPQLAEFDLRCGGQDYDSAADVVFSICFDYLRVWGHYHLMVEMNERLQGKLADPDYQRGNVAYLGIAYESLGRYQMAIICYEQALECAREKKDRWAEGALLGNLGGCHFRLGQTERAIECNQQSLAITQEVGNRKREPVDLDNLSVYYASLGQTSLALSYIDRALTINREIEDYEGEGCILTNLVETLIDELRYQEAMQQAIEAISIASEINSPDLLSHGYSNLALAHLYSENLDNARTAAETARQ
jgi:tetratricopeptide (TPR) repeat protein